MLEVRGDCFTYAEEINADAVCILTNKLVVKGELIMGGGQALAAKKRWPSLPKTFGDVIAGDDITAHETNIIRVDHEVLDINYDVVSFPTKYRPSEPSDLGLISNCATDLGLLADALGWNLVVIPRPGVGLGGLDYESQVRPVIEPILDDRFHVITFAN